MFNYDFFLKKKIVFQLAYFKIAIFLYKKMHIFQIASLLVFTLVFSRICWINVIYFFKKIMYFVYISTYLGKTLVIE